MTAVTRNESGQFVKGVSGNPAGRPKGKKNQITELKQDLELAVRRQLGPDQIGNIVQKMAELAAEGNVQAAKLILDKTVSNAKDTEDAEQAGNTLQIVVKNATLSVGQVEGEGDSNPPIEGELHE